MLIALDYDDTYTHDPVLWDAFIANAKARGHEVICVTMRYAKEGMPVVKALSSKVDAIVFTGRTAKARSVHSLGYYPNVWIEDNPNLILQDATF